MKSLLERLFSVDPSIVIQQPTALNEAELRAAFAVPDTAPLWRAVLQLIDEEERAANRMAQKSVANHGITASFIGGAEWLGRLRLRLVSLREQALQGRQPGSELRVKG